MAPISLLSALNVYKTSVPFREILAQGREGIRRQCRLFFVSLGILTWETSSTAAGYTYLYFSSARIKELEEALEPKCLELQRLQKKCNEEEKG